MARGFGARPTRTGKCKCDTPKWRTFSHRATSVGELVITLECQSCKAMWDSKSREARKYVSLDGTASFSNSTRQVTTYQEIMEYADRLRQSYLRREIQNKLEIMEGLQREIQKAQKELEFLEEAPLVP